MTPPPDDASQELPARSHQDHLELLAEVDAAPELEAGLTGRHNLLLEPVTRQDRVDV